MHSYSFDGIVIKRSNLKEADKLITIYTRQLGKITLIAKGIRKSTSKRTGSLELFNHVRASAIVGKGDLDIITEVQVVTAFDSWRKYLGRVAVAYQLVETVDKLTADNQPQPRIFEILQVALQHISALGSDWQPQIESWLSEILQELGYLPTDHVFTGDVYQFIESTSARSFNSAKFLKKIKN